MEPDLKAHSHTAIDWESDLVSHRENMGYKAISAIAIAMTCKIAMWIVLYKCYETFLATSVSQSPYVNVPKRSLWWYAMGTNYC